MSTRTLLRRAVRAADAFAAPHGIDRYVEQVVPTWSSTEVRGRIVEVDRSTPDSVVLTIRPNGNWDGFRPGQYTQLTVEIDGVRHTRCYSMCSAADGGRTFQLGIKAHHHGLVSRHLVAHAAVGDVVGLTPARGTFHLSDERPGRLLLVSGGSGITPVLSMLRTLCAEGHRGPVTFLHYAPSPEHQLFRHEIAALEAAHDNVRVVLGYERGDAGHLRGLLDETHLDAADPQWRAAEAYVCGPGPLMDAVRGHYEAAGAADRFHQEAFTLTNVVAESGATGGTLRFTASGVTAEAGGATVLETAEAAGLAPAHGCRMGICHTCTRDLICGTVRDVTTGDVTTTDANGSAVEIRVCVSAPVGDVEIDL